jgi:integrase
VNSTSARSKPRAGQRNLPLLSLASQALQAQLAQQASYRLGTGSAWPSTDLVFTSRTGRPVEPRNFVRSFRRICEQNNIRMITVHHVRHTIASLLKELAVPARDAQIILGHSRLAVTLEIYTHADEHAQREALTRLHDLFGRASD